MTRTAWRIIVALVACAICWLNAGCADDGPPTDYVGCQIRSRADVLVAVSEGKPCRNVVVNGMSENDLGELLALDNLQILSLQRVNFDSGSGCRELATHIGIRVVEVVRCPTFSDSNLEVLMSLAALTTFIVKGEHSLSRTTIVDLKRKFPAVELVVEN